MHSGDHSGDGDYLWIERVALRPMVQAALAGVAGNDHHDDGGRRQKVENVRI